MKIVFSQLEIDRMRKFLKESTKKGKGLPTLETLETKLLIQTLVFHNGHILKTAKSMGISPKSVYNKLGEKKLTGLQIALRKDAA